jgi:hypothetical protein
VGERSRGRYATQTDSPRHDGTPHRGLRVRRWGLGSVHRASSIMGHFLSRRAKPSVTIRDFRVAVYLAGLGVVAQQRVAAGAGHAQRASALLPATALLSLALLALLGRRVALAALRGLPLRLVLEARPCEHHLPHAHQRVGYSQCMLEASAACSFQSLYRCFSSGVYHVADRSSMHLNVAPSFADRAG